MLYNRKNYDLMDPAVPELYREQFPWNAVPPILFDGKTVPLSPAKEMWITDTTFRDGQQSRAPYKVEEIIHIYDLLSRLGGPEGLIRQSEFFIYSKRDLQALEGCRAIGHRFPEITSWIRANHQDLQLVKDLEIAETGILTSVSDYHIFLKLKKNRKKVMEDYLSVVKEALDKGIRPRCHFEDITRADIYGFCIPFAAELLKLSHESGIPIKIRLCDTMGYGITYPGAVLPRSIPKMVYAFHKELGYPSELLEWHGHNDFHKVHINASSSWLYGVSALNASLLGYGERTGNPPLEGAIMELLALRGEDCGVDTRIITEIARYFQKEIKADIPKNYPFIGEDFNTTRAGIHADGILKNQEIYNIFDTDLLLNRPIRVTVTDKSGMAGIARWLNENVPSVVEGRSEPVNKRHSGVKHINNWVTEQYEQGRTTGISPEELLAQARHYLPSLFESDFDLAKEKAVELAHRLGEEISLSSSLHSGDIQSIEDFLHVIVKREGAIQMLAITDLEGNRISQVHTQKGEKGLFRNLLTKNFRDKDWFIQALETGKPYYSDLYFSRFTGELILTAAIPVCDKKGGIMAVVDADFKFRELVKMIHTLPEEVMQSRGLNRSS